MVTDVVMQVLNEQGQNVTWETFHDQREPKLYGDVLILPINGFAANQKHSHAGDPAYGEPYVSHHFGRSWYNPDNAGGPGDKDNKEDGKKADAKDDGKKDGVQGDEKKGGVTGDEKKDAAKGDEKGLQEQAKENS
jgi:hypothetical protein